MHTTRNIQNNIAENGWKHPPVWGNLPVLMAVADEAGRILSWKLTKQELEELVGYCLSHYGDTGREREYFDRLDPDALHLIFTRLPDRSARYQIARLIENYKLRGFIKKNPEKLWRLIEILISVAKKPGKSDESRDSFSLFDYALNLGYTAIEETSPDEFLDFLKRYTGVLSSFDNCDHDRAEYCLGNAYKKKYWQKLFLFLELVEAPPRVGILWYPHDQEGYFENLTEEDIRFIADIAPKNSYSSAKVLEEFSISKKKLPPQQHNKLWQRIGTALRENPISGFLISHYFHDVSHNKSEIFMDIFEFSSEFGRMAGKNLQYSNEIHGLNNLRKEISDFSDTMLKSPRDSVIFQLLATCEKGSIGEFTRTIRTHLENLPEIGELTILIRHVERIVKKRSNDSKGYAGLLSYLIRFRKHPESLSALEVFSEKYPTRSALMVLDNFLPEYESGWENNPLYDVAIKNEPKKEDFPSDSEGVSAWLNGAIGVFISLCRSGMSVDDCEKVFTRIHRSKAHVRTVSSILLNLREPEDFISFLSIFIHRPKSFQKLLRIIAPITEDGNGTRDEEKNEYLYETLSKYIRFTVWKSLSDEEIVQIAGVGDGSYTKLIAEKCHECSIPVETFEKTIAGFSKAVRAYPDIRKYQDKFARFEKELFDLEARCMLERVRKYYIAKLKLPEDFPISAFEKEENNTLLYILTTNNRNMEIGGKLLLQVAKNHEAGREGLPFRSRENDTWLRANLDSSQKKSWLARNEKTYEVTDVERKTDESVEREIEKFLSVARGLLENVSHKGSVNTSSAEGFCEALPKFLQENPGFDAKFSKDLKLQADSINRIFHRAKSRSVSSVRMYRETDPLRIVMMGDWVDGSCLASHSSIRNSWSVIANATEANKAVFYAEDEKGNVIGRVLMAIDQNNRLVPFRVYIRGNPDVDLIKIFEKYLREFSETLKMWFGWDPKEVKNILGCEWYMDPVWKIGGNEIE